MKSILVVDDEKDIIDFIRYNLQKEGFSVSAAKNGRQAVELSAKMPDLILLDVMMPELDGFEALKEIRRNPRTGRIPVIFLTAKGTDVDEVLGLELGADDYIVKPISIPKLIARIKNVLRKQDTLRNEEQPKSIRFGRIEISPSQHTVKVDGKEIFFPKKEFEVLYYLASRTEQVVRRETLLRAIWGSDVLVVDRTIDVHIRKIREKLGKFADYIETIKGVGYKIREQMD